MAKWSAQSSPISILGNVFAIGLTTRPQTFQFKPFIIDTICSESSDEHSNVGNRTAVTAASKAITARRLNHLFPSQ